MCEVEKYFCRIETIHMKDPFIQKYGSRKQSLQVIYITSGQAMLKKHIMPIKILFVCVGILKCYRKITFFME